MKTFFTLLLILSCASYAHAGNDNNKKSVRLTPTNLGEQIYKSGEKARLLLDFSGVKVTEESGLKDFNVSPSDYEFHAFFPDGMSRSLLIILGNCIIVQ